VVVEVVRVATRTSLWLTRVVLDYEKTKFRLPDRFNAIEHEDVGISYIVHELDAGV